MEPKEYIKLIRQSLKKENPNTQEILDLEARKLKAIKYFQSDVSIEEKRKYADSYNLIIKRLNELRNN